MSAKTLLVFRMSSLGDVILSTAFLENLPPQTTVDWVIASDFAFVLRGHPKIRRLIEFDKKTGLKGWLSLLKALKQERYDARVDLHVTLRSRIAKLYYALTPGSWFSISKQRLRFLGYVTLKEAWPRAWRPTPFWKRFARLGASFSDRASGGIKDDALKPPAYAPMLEARQGEARLVLERYGLQSKKYYAFMPASRWASKEWSAEKYVELASTLHALTGATILLLGRERDPACQKVANGLRERQIPWTSALQEPDFAVTALLLQQCVAYVGGDTGLAHLSEAVGAPSVVLFGPTRPDLGFGPWSRRSVSVFSDVACSPCSKDGKNCYRFSDPYACLKRIEVDRVRGAIPK